MQTKHSQSKIRLDLTKHLLSTIFATNDSPKVNEIGFSFADVNCRLYAKIGNRFHHFSSLEDFEALLHRLDIDAGGSKDLREMEPDSVSQQ